jgi:hypothetical protein
MIEAFGWHLSDLQLGMVLGSFLTLAGLWATGLAALALFKAKAVEP